MGIKEVIETINRMKADGVIERYAIGGAVGATFYLEPVATLDVDVFVELHIPPGSQFVSPEPIFKYLRDRGCKMKGEHITAIALETGRAKDKARVLQFLEAGVLDRDRLREILRRHGLTGDWQRFERQFLEEK